MGLITGTFALNDDWSFMREHLVVERSWGCREFQVTFRVVSLPSSLTGKVNEMSLHLSAQPEMQN